MDEDHDESSDPCDCEEVAHGKHCLPWFGLKLSAHSVGLKRMVNSMINILLFDLF